MSPGEPRRCPSCGASAARLDARFCEYCGSTLAAPAPAPERVEPADLDARFRALSAHPELAQLMDLTPEAPELAGASAVALIALVVFGLVGLFVSFGFFYVCPPLGVIPLALIGFGAFAMLRQLGRARATRRSPLERRPALVVETRMQLEGEGEHTSARAHHFATLAFEDGTRSELHVLERVAGQLANGQMGVAYVRGETLIAFERLSV